MSKERVPVEWSEVRRRLRASEHALQAALLPDEKATREALQRNARRLAEASVGRGAPADAVKLLVFRLGQDKFAVDLKYVAEVSAMPRCTPVPGVPNGSGASAALCGVICHRGEVRSVLDLGGLLGRTRDEEMAHGFILHLSANGREVRLRVSAVDQIITSRASELKAAPASDAATFGGRVKAIHPDGIVVLAAEVLCGGQAETQKGEAEADASTGIAKAA